jgi:hypothetical protein
MPDEIPGLITKGNIDLSKRPIVRNPDGSISTVRSMSFNQNGREILIPTVAADGSGILSNKEAIAQYRQTGKHLGIFSSPKTATAYAQTLHQKQAKQYMAKNDDDLVKRYAAETRGMPPNLARIAARNLAAQDAAIARTDVIRNRIAGTEHPPEYIGSRYGPSGGDVGIPQGAPPGYYGSQGRFLGPLGGAAPAGATGLVGAAAAATPKPFAPVTPTVRNIEFGDVPGILTGLTGLPFQRNQNPETITGFLGRFLARSVFNKFLPGVGSIFNTRPRPYQPIPLNSQVSNP